MPIDHPLVFFGSHTEFAGTGKDIRWPLLRDQDNSAYMRDTGDPTTAEGGMIEWGYYEERACRAWSTPATFWTNPRPACRRRSATWRWTRSWRPRSVRWN